MLRPEPLEARHDPGDFDCGEPELDAWLRDHVLPSHRAEFSKSYVIHEGDLRIRGYYTLAAGAVGREEAPERVSQVGGGHQIPVVVLARLAVQQSLQGQGYGKGLVRDALYRVAATADIIGVRAVLVHMKSPRLQGFYEDLDFEPSPISDKQMFLLMKDLWKALAP